MSINTSELNTSIEQFGEDMNLTHNWVQGAVGSSVTLGGVSTPSIRSLVAALLNAGGAAVVRQTKAELAALLNHGENTLGFVTNDETATNNGWYIKVGSSGTGSWKQSTYDRTVTQAQLASYVHSVSLITSSNAEAVCGGDVDGILPNTIYAINHSSAQLANMPVEGNGLILTLSRNAPSLSATACQIFFTQDAGQTFTRGWSGSAWTAWKKIIHESDLDTALENAVTGGGSLITESNANAICGGSLSGLATQTLYTVAGTSGLTDLPVKANGLVATLSRGAYAAGAWPAASGQVYLTQKERPSLYFRSAGSGGSTAAYRWGRAVQTDALKILAVGDSICNGARNSHLGYVGNLGYDYANYGISSWRLSNTREGYGPIASQLDTFAADAADSTKSVYGFAPDVIIGEGGINDYSNNVPLGTVPTAPVDATPNTLIGGLQHLFYKMIVMYPYAQRLFVIVHKMGNADGTKYYPTDANSVGYTQEDMVDAMLETCRIYGVKPVDVYHEGQMDTKFNVYLGDWAADNNSPAWCNIDRCHPLQNGYLNVYCPLIMQALVGGTKKE